MEAKKPDNDNDNEDDKDNDNEEDNDTDLHSKLYDENVERVQKTIITTLGNTNLTVIQEAIDYLEELPIEVIEEALVRTARKQKKWDYARGILDNWISDNLDSIDKIKANDLNFFEKTSPPVEEKETEEEKKARKIKELEDFINGS